LPSPFWSSAPVNSPRSEKAWAKASENFKSAMKDPEAEKKEKKEEEKKS